MKNTDEKQLDKEVADKKKVADKKTKKNIKQRERKRLN